MRRRPVLMLACVALVAASGARCRRTDVAAEPARADHAAPASRGPVAGAPIDAARAADAATLVPGALGTVAAVPVTDRTGPGARPFDVAARTRAQPSAHARRFGRRTLGIGLRVGAPDLGRYPCTACHAGSALTATTDRLADAHDDVAAEHPASSGA